MKVAFIFFPPWDPQYPPYVTALFKGSTLRAGHEFFGFDLNADIYNMVPAEDKKLWGAQVANLWQEDRENLIQRYSIFIDYFVDSMAALGIDLYAMSINVFSKHMALHTARKIKEKNPSSQIFSGGPQCFPASDHLKILQNRYVDAICTGEGDQIWPRALDHFEKHGNLKLDIPGLSYKDEHGNIVDNSVPEKVMDLNSVPYADYSDVDFRKYGNKFQFGMMTSRGCINTCAFCSERPNFSPYRFRSADNVYGEIVKHMEGLRANPSIPRSRDIYPYVSFNDSLINGVPKELDRLCDLIIQGGHKFAWGGMALMRKELTGGMLAKMKKAGCYHLAWGLESGCQEVLNLMRKKFFDMTLARQVINAAHEAGINQSISLIAGFPGETEEMFRETLEFVADHKEYLTVSIQPMVFIKNCLVFDRPQDFGIEPGSDYLKWQTVDGTNTYDIRLRRVEALRKVLDGKLITIDK